MIDIFTDHKTIWFIAGLAFIAAEFVVPGVTLLFFGVGALITAACLHVFLLSTASQTVIFLVSSMAGIFFLHSRIKTKLFSPKAASYSVPGMSHSEFAGVEVEVIADIAPPHPGRILLHGTSWQAHSKNAVNKGSRVKITGRDGLMVIVEEIP